MDAPAGCASRLESAIGADVAQLVERELPKLEVAGSKPVVRFGRLPLSHHVVRRRADPGRLGRHLGERSLPRVVEGRAQGHRARARRRARARCAVALRVAQQAALLAGVRPARHALRAALSCSRRTRAASSRASGSGGCTRVRRARRWSTAGTCRRTRAWMNRLAPMGRPAFAWNHDYVMRHGAQGLAERLGASSSPTTESARRLSARTPNRRKRG